ncbi:MAG: bacteriohemerythrin [Christensenellaceae bacterium]|jgi:hemerythrin
MSWHSNLKTGLTRFDRQHQEIFRRLELILYVDESRNMEDSFIFIEDYFLFHTAQEERLHEELAYPKAGEHRDEHEAFGNFAQRFRRESMQSERDADALLVTYSNITSLLTQHIKEHDRDFAEYFLSLGKPAL